MTFTECSVHYIFQNNCPIVLKINYERHDPTKSPLAKNNSHATRIMNTTCLQVCRFNAQANQTRTCLWRRSCLHHPLGQWYVPLVLSETGKCITNSFTIITIDSRLLPSLKLHLQHETPTAFSSWGYNNIYRSANVAQYFY